MRKAMSSRFWARWAILVLMYCRSCASMSWKNHSQKMFRLRLMRPRGNRRQRNIAAVLTVAICLSLRLMVRTPKISTMVFMRARMRTDRISLAFISPMSAGMSVRISRWTARPMSAVPVSIWWTVSFRCCQKSCPMGSAA